MLEKFFDQQCSYGEMVGWCHTSDELLKSAEHKLLSHIKSLEDEGIFADIGSVVGNTENKVLTYRANIGSANTPLVLLHGFGCPSGFWCLNVDSLAQHRPVYFMDLLGFGRSSRPTFSRDPLTAEDELVESLEAWRKVVGLDRFIVLGHSLGAYIATVYAFKYPHRVVHLVLEDPWGFPQQVGRYNNNSLGVMTMWVLSHFVPPLFLLRWLGPLGHWYVRWKPPFDTHNYGRATPDHEQAVYEYFYHSNARNPTGEVAFHALMKGVAWALHPLINRIHALRGDVPITFLHGERSWVSKKTSYKVKEIRKDSFVDVKIIPDAGHVIHSDVPDVFNSTVNEILAGIDDGTLPSSSAQLPRGSNTRAHQDPRPAGRDHVSKDAEGKKQSSNIFAHSGMLADVCQRSVAR